MNCNYDPIITVYDTSLSRWREIKPIYTSVKYSYSLNETSTASFDYKLDDIAIVGLLDFQKKVRITENNLIVFSGYIVNLKKSINNGDSVLSVDCHGLTQDLADKYYQVTNVLLENEYVTDLLDPVYAKTLIPTGWTTTVEPTTEVITYLTSLQSKLSTYKIFNKFFGYNWRHRIINNPVLDEKHLDFGLFGNYNGVKIYQTPKDNIESVDNWLVIDENGVNLEKAGDHVFNWVYPIGGAGDNGVNQVSLRDCIGKPYIDPNYPILIDTDIPNTDSSYNASVYSNGNTAPNTGVQYYVANLSSIAQYGIIKRSIQFKDVEPQASNQDKVLQLGRDKASELLYKGVVAELKKHSQPLEYMSGLGAIGHAPNLNVGDKVKIKFKKQVKDIDGNCYDVVNIDNEYYVLSYICEYLEDSTKKYNLNISNLPVFAQSDLDILSDTVEVQKDYEKQRKGSVSVFSQTFERVFDNLNPAQAFFWIPKGLTYTDYLDMKLTLKPFTSTVSGATNPAQGFTVPAQTTSAGGGTTTTSSAGGSTTVTSGAGGSTTTTSSNSATHNHTITIANHTHNITIPIANRTTGTVLTYTPASPELGTAGGGSIFNANGASAGGGTTTTSTNGGVHNHTITIGNHTHTITIGNHTHSITIADHTHTITSQTVNIPSIPINLTYGVYQSTVAPTGVRIYIDGVDYSSQLGTYNAFGEYPSGQDQTFDLLLASYNLGQINSLLTGGRHKIEVYCQTGGGTMEINMYNQFYLSSR